MANMGLRDAREVDDKVETSRMLRNELHAFSQKELRSQLADLRAKLREDFRAELHELQHHFKFASLFPGGATHADQSREKTVVGANSKHATPRKIGDHSARSVEAAWRLPDSEELSLAGRLAFLREAREEVGRKQPGRPVTSPAVFMEPPGWNSPARTEDLISAKNAQLRSAAYNGNNTSGVKQAVAEEGNLIKPTLPEEPLHPLAVLDMETMPYKPVVQNHQLNGPSPPEEPLHPLAVLDMETTPYYDTAPLKARTSEVPAIKTIEEDIKEVGHLRASSKESPGECPRGRSVSRFSDIDALMQEATANSTGVGNTTFTARKYASAKLTRIATASCHSTLFREQSAKRHRRGIRQEDTKLFFTHVKSRFNRKTQQGSQISTNVSLFGDDSELSSWQKGLRCLGKYADYPVAFAIFLNGVFLGVQTQHQSSNMTQAVPPIFPVFEVVFCIVFTAELLFRLVRHRYNFFIMKGWKWNVFDFFLVLMQVVEVIGMMTTEHETQSAPATANVSYLRLLRILRLFRVLRLVRLLQFIGELNTIISSITNSMRPLFWTMILLLLMIYMVGIVFTQIVTSHRMELREVGTEEDDHDIELSYWFGSLWRTILSLYEAILGGVDWDSLVYPLVHKISVLVAPIFMFYIAFVILAMMNVITGIFVESALKNASKEQEMEFYNATKELFSKGAREEDTGFVTKEHFYNELSQPGLQAYLRQVGIEVQDAELMFTLLDADNVGEINLDDLLAGLLRLRSSAKVLDIALFMHETEAQHSQNFQCLSTLEHLVTTAAKDPGANGKGVPTAPKNGATALY